MNTPDPDRDVTEVPVQAAVLRATAHLLELLGGFFTTDPAIQLSLGAYLIDRQGPEVDTDSITEAVTMLKDLSDAAGLLQALAGNYSRGNGAASEQQ